MLEQWLLAALHFVGGRTVPVAAPRQEVQWSVSLDRFFTRERCDRVIDKRYLRICFDDRARGPRYVGYVLDGAKVNARNIEQRPGFYPERRVPVRVRVLPGDYTRNPWRMDRGHLAPDAAFDWSPASLKATYSMANVIPQYYRINRKTWIKAERYARLMASKIGRVMVLNGVEYGDYGRRLKKGVGQAVPLAFWKAVWSRKTDLRRCFYYVNEPISRREANADRLRDHEVDCRVFLGGRR